MAVEVLCPNPSCGNTERVPEEYLGRSVRCTRCGESLVVGAQRAPACEGGEQPQSARVTVAPGGVELTTTGASAPVTSPPSAALETAAAGRIGRFEIRARLGEGAFGTVYRAFDPELERDVALKVAKSGTLTTPRRIERFLREAKAAAQLRHPHIVPVYDAGRDGEQYYIAAAYIPGHTLEQAIDDEKLDFRGSARVACQLAEALGYAHGLGIVHRDVKPANVMLDDRGDAHLMDFGLAHWHQAARLTQEKVVMGTPAYMAPEQAAGNSADARPGSDQYSLGIVLYELLCGKTPFSGPPEIQIYHHAHTAPPPPSQCRPQVPHDLETICIKALAKRPEDRYASCQALASDLRRWLGSEPSQTRPNGMAARTFQRLRRRPALAIALGLAVAFLAVLIPWLAGQFAAPRHQVEDQPAPSGDQGGIVQKQNSKPPEPAAKDGPKQPEADVVKQPPPAEKPKPALALALSTDALSLAAGETAILKVTVERQNGCQGKCFFEFKGLPNRVTAKLAPLAPDQDRADVELSAGADAAEDVKAVNVEATVGELTSTRALKITIERPALTMERLDAVKIAAGNPKGAVLEVRVKRRRYEGDITVKVEDLPDHVTAKPVIIPKDEESAEVNLVAAEAADAGVSKIRVRATLDKLTAVGETELTTLWPVGERNKVKAKLPTNIYKPFPLALSPDGRFFLIGDRRPPDGRVAIGDVKTGKWIGTFEGLRENVESAAFSNDSKQVLASCSKALVLIWKADDGKVVKVLQGYNTTTPVRQVAFASKGASVLYGTEKAMWWWNGLEKDAATRVWQDSTYKGPPFFYDGVEVIFAGTNGTLVMGNLETGQLEFKVTVINKAKPVITCLAMSPDGRTIVIGLSDGTMQVRDPRDPRFKGREVRAFASPHKASVNCLAFSPDSRRVLSGDSEGMARYWDVATGKELEAFKGHPAGIKCMVITADSRRAVSFGVDLTIIEWGLPPP